ncbi:WD40-repeat-containing domain protein [Stachybotrys elegans]|uniref:Nuclear distribution protein PAC1 n=1 Tax=Stachybotrys elegans TaxID=80388 RepID=A0A8K0WS71_9HYPO|nr:WD40-repeat-containing domain protein [Stachybotrys elegans]
MSRILTARQAEELHKSIIAYLAANGLPSTAAALRAELNLGEETFDAETAKKYETLLEKKWTSVVRLQKKIMELETRSATLQSELENVSPAFLSKRNQDPASWLPRSPPRHSLESHRDTVNCVAFHPVFSSIASGSDDCTIKIWDWEFGELERTIKAHTQAVRDVDFGGPKGGVLMASCSTDLTIKLWDPADGYKNIRTLQGHDHSISTVRFVPSGNLLVSASGDQTLRLWDTATGYCVKTLSGHAGWVRDVYPSIDGRFLLSTGNDRTIRLWDISLSNPENIATLAGHENVIKCCALAPPTSYQYLAAWAGMKTPPPATSTAEFMASGSRDKTIKIWDARGTCLGTLVGHDNWVSAIAFHPGGKYLLSVADDKTLRCWDLSQEGKCVKVLGDAHEQFITCLRWATAASGDAPASNGAAADGQRGQSNAPNPQIRCVIATGSMDTTVRVFAN